MVSPTLVNPNCFGTLCHTFAFVVYLFSPHLCVGFLFLILYPGLRLLLLRLLPPSSTTLSIVNKHFVHTLCQLSTNTLSTHTLSTDTL